MKFMFTASNINSIDINRTIRFFRLRKIPTTPIAKRIAASIKKWDSVSKVPPWFLLHVTAVLRRHLVFLRVRFLQLA
jgi:hypothetical protein